MPLAAPSARAAFGLAGCVFGGGVFFAEEFVDEAERTSEPRLEADEDLQEDLLHGAEELFEVSVEWPRGVQGVAVGPPVETAGEG